MLDFLGGFPGLLYSMIHIIV